jgi:hypothetical protein
VELERYAINGLGDAVASAELYLQLIDLEQQTVDGLPYATTIEEFDVGRSATSH